MTFEAKPPLALFVKRLVTTFAGLFEFGVTLDDVAGFDEFLKQTLAVNPNRRNQDR